MNVKSKEKEGRKPRRKTEDVMISNRVSSMLSQDVCIGAQRRTVNDTACSVPRMRGLFLDTWPLSHNTAGRGLAQRKVKNMY